MLAPLIGQCPTFQPSHWPQTSWCISDQVCYRGPGDDIAICHDSYDGLMIVTLLSRGSDQSEPSIRSIDQSEASIKSIDQLEASSLSPHVYCNDNWGHIKCDGDFLAHNECIVNITLLKCKYKTDCKTYHFQNSVWCICLATLVTTRRSILGSVCPTK